MTCLLALGIVDWQFYHCFVGMWIGGLLRRPLYKRFLFLLPLALHFVFALFLPSDDLWVHGAHGDVNVGKVLFLFRRCDLIVVWAPPIAAQYFAEAGALDTHYHCVSLGVVFLAVSMGAVSWDLMLPCCVEAVGPGVCLDGRPGCLHPCLLIVEFGSGVVQLEQLPLFIGHLRLVEGVPP